MKYIVTRIAKLYTWLISFLGAANVAEVENTVEPCETVTGLIDHLDMTSKNAYTSSDVRRILIQNNHSEIAVEACIDYLISVCYRNELALRDPIAEQEELNKLRSIPGYQTTWTIFGLTKMNNQQDFVIRIL